MSKKFFDIRVACMFAVLMVGAACAEAVKKAKKKKFHQFKLYFLSGTQ